MFPILNPPPSSLPIPSLWVVPVHQPQASSIVHRIWTGDSFHTWYYTCFNAILPNLPSLSLSRRVHKTDLYISVSFAVSYTGLLFFILSLSMASQGNKPLVSLFREYLLLPNILSSFSLTSLIHTCLLFHISVSLFYQTTWPSVFSISTKDIADNVWGLLENIFCISWQGSWIPRTKAAKKFYT